MTYPRGPRLLKGAIIAVGAVGARASAIIFQYNPESLRRSLQPQMLGGQGGGRVLTMRFTGAPIETIDVEVTINAIDQLEHGEVASGIHPQLLALEMLLYPASQQVVQNTQLLDQGTIEIGPYNAPLTLFIWGPNRVLPVTLLNCSITEEAFDVHLNPIQATISLNMRAISYSDIDSQNQAYNLFLAYQKHKESLALRGILGDPTPVIGIDPNQF